MRLPYLSPRMFVVDAMHNIWEGLFRDLLGKLLNRPDGMGLWEDDESAGEKSGGDDEEDEDDREADDMEDGGDGDAVGAKRLKSWEELIRSWKFPRSVGPMMGKIGHKLSKLKVTGTIIRTHTHIYTYTLTTLTSPHTHTYTPIHTYKRIHSHTSTRHDHHRVRS
jgi:hypothetical protein